MPEPTMEYRGHTGIYGFDASLGMFTGHVVAIRGDEVYFEGASLEELRGSFERAVDHYLAVIARDGG